MTPFKRFSRYLREAVRCSMEVEDAIFGGLLGGFSTVVFSASLLAGPRADAAQDWSIEEQSTRLSFMVPDLTPQFAEEIASEEKQGVEGEEMESAALDSQLNTTKERKSPAIPVAEQPKEKGIGEVDSERHRPKSDAKRGDGTGKRVRKARKARRKRKACTPKDTGIVKSGGSYQVPRELVDKYTDNAEAAQRLGVVAWHRGKTGEIEGIEVVRIHCGSPVRKMGIRRGDVITSVNGRAVDSLPRAASAYLKLRRKGKLSLQLVRKGEKVSVNYRVVG
jgi:hypothetical protein